MAWKSNWLRFKRTLPLTVMLIPGVILIFIFCYIPMVGLILPFKNYKASLGFFGSPWAGLVNFEFLIHSKTMWVALKNTVLYNFAFILIGNACSVLLASMLFELKASRVKIFQTIFLLPYFVSWVVASYVVNAFLDMDAGVINNILIRFGLKEVLWYNDPRGWPLIILLTYLWKSVGYITIIYYAALMGLDVECFEAAELDGVTWFQRLRYIMLPGIQNVVWIMVLLAVGNVLHGDFGLFYNVPLNSALLYSSTDVVDTVVYRALLKIGDIGMSSAAGFFQSICGFILIVVVNFIVKKKNPEHALF